MTATATATTATPVAALDVAGLLAGFRRRELDPVEVIESCLARLDAVDHEAHGIVTVVAARAREEAARSARRWTTGQARPLEGVPFGVKDVIATAAVRTSLGSERWSDWVPADDARSVALLREAGAVLDRKSVVQGKSEAVRVDLGVGR